MTQSLTNEQIKAATDKFGQMLRNMVVEDLDQYEIQARLDKNISNFAAILEEQNYFMRESKIRLFTTAERAVIESFDDNPWADNYVREIYQNQHIVRERMREALIKP